MSLMGFKTYDNTTAIIHEMPEDEDRNSYPAGGILKAESTKATLADGAVEG